jgi:hypothetical protein
MKMPIKKSVQLLIGVLIIVWFALFIFTPPMPDTPRAPHFLQTLERQANNLNAKQMSREELDVAISRLPLDLHLNRYIPHVEYNSPADWRVVLIPEERKTYANPSTRFYRITTLDFDRFAWPDIVIDSQNQEHNQGSHRTAVPLRGSAAGEP